MEIIITVIGMVAIYLMIFWFLDSMMHGTKSHRYRKRLVDLYVVAKIKEVAKEENINLDEEYKKFIKLCRGRPDLDDRIESKLTDQLDKKNKEEEEK